MIADKIKKFFYFGYYYVLAHMILLLHYDKKYITARWFYEEKYHGLGAIGWKWVVVDYRMSKKMGVNKGCPWPISPLCKVSPSYDNISFDMDDLNLFQGNIYFQTYGHITVGKGTYIANNVGIITANHDFDNLDNHSEAKDVYIGEKCWIGMNAMILPGVELGPHTIVGAGSVVTKSFPKGNCVIVGNPAKVIR